MEFAFVSVLGVAFGWFSGPVTNLRHLDRNLFFNLKGTKLSNVSASLSKTNERAPNTNPTPAR